MTKFEKQLIESKLANLRVYIDRVENLNITTEEKFLEDYDIQDLLVFRLIRCVEVSIDIATHLVASLNLPRKDTSKEVFHLLGEKKILSKKTSNALSNAAGFRNLAVHEYDSADFSIRQVFKDYKKDIVDLKRFKEEIILFLKKHKS